MSAWGDFSTLDILFGVGKSDACTVVRSGESLETPCGRKFSLLASPFVSIGTIAAGSNDRPWRWVYSRVCIAQCTGRATRSPKHLYARLVFLFVAYVRGDRSRVV